MRSPPILLAGVWLLAAACADGPIQERDLPLLITTADLQAYGVDLDSLADRQVFRRSRHLDGSMTIEYEFASPDEADESFFISTTAGFERSLRDARTTFGMLKSSVGFGTRLGGGTMQIIPGFYEWGDDSFFAVIDGGNGPGGNVFGTRVGTKTYIVMLAGIYFDDRDEWDEFIRPKLEYLTSYDPNSE